jgi:hypothetical protein
MKELSLMLHVAGIFSAVVGVYFGGQWYAIAMVAHVLAVPVGMGGVPRRRLGFTATVSLVAFSAAAIAFGLFVAIGAGELLLPAIVYGVLAVPALLVAGSSAIGVVAGGAK